MDMLNINSVKDYASRMASQVSTDSIKDKANSAQSDEELMDACKEFETYLWEQVIKSMKDTVNVFGKEEGEGSQYVDYFMDTAITEVAGNLTDKNLGPNSLAQQMFEQMKRTNTIDVEALLAESAAASGISSEE